MVFYFSATGNSKYVAQRVTQKLNDKLISMAECLKEEKFFFEVSQEECIGFIFPTYFYGVPTIVADFIGKLELKNYNTQYVFTIVTCGNCSGGGIASI